MMFLDENQHRVSFLRRSGILMQIVFFWKNCEIRQFFLWQCGGIRQFRSPPSKKSVLFLNKGEKKVYYSKQEKKKCTIPRKSRRKKSVLFPNIFLGEQEKKCTIPNSWGETKKSVLFPIPVEKPKKKCTIPNSWGEKKCTIPHRGEKKVYYSSISGEKKVYYSSISGDQTKSVLFLNKRRKKNCTIPRKKKFDCQCFPMFKPLPKDHKSLLFVLSDYWQK